MKKGFFSRKLASIGSALSILLPSSAYAATPKKPDVVKEAEEVLKESPLMDKEIPLYERYKYDIESTLDGMVSLLYPSSGRFEWVFALGEGRWGKHKVTHKGFDWKKFESKRFEVLSYDPKLAGEFATFAEDAYEEFGKEFKLHKFDRKNIVVLYNTRIDFEQTMLWPGLVPEGLGGFTFTREIDDHKIAFLFEGSKGMFYRIGKHELHHRFSIEKLKEVSRLHKAKHEFPVWLEEGGAEYGAIGWDAQSEMIIRDAYFNDYFVPINSIDYILGTWLMYKEGQFVSKVIAEKFGEEKLMTLRENTKLKNFNENLKASLGITFADLDLLVNEELSKKYSALRKEKDFVSKSEALGPGTIMAHHGDVFVIGETRTKKHPDEDKLYLSYMGEDKRFSKEIEHDRDLGRETLHWLVNGAALDEDTVAYGVRNNEGDVLKIRDFKIVGGKFNLEKVREYRFDDVEVIKHPVFVKDELYFVGYNKKGYGDLFRFDEKTKKVEKLTDWKADINSLTFSEKLGKFVLSREDNEPGLVKGIDFNYNLYTLDPATWSLEKLTATPENETKASVSPDGGEVLFTSDKDMRVELHMMDLGTKKTFKVSDSKVGSFNASFLTDDEIVFHSIDKMRKMMHRTKIPSLEDLAKAWEGGREEESLGDLKTKGGSLFVHDERVEKTVFADKPYLLTKDSVYVKEGDTFVKWKEEKKSLDDVLATVENVIVSDVSADGETLAVVTNNILSFDTTYPVSVKMFDKSGTKLWEYGVKLRPKSTHGIRAIHNLGKSAVLDAAELMTFSEEGSEVLFRKSDFSPAAFRDKKEKKSKLLVPVVSKDHGYVAAWVRRAGRDGVLIFQDGKETFFDSKGGDIGHFKMGSDGELLFTAKEDIPTKTTVVYKYDHSTGIFNERELKSPGTVTFLDSFEDEVLAKVSRTKEKKSKLPDLEKLVALTPEGEKVLLEDYGKIGALRRADGKVFFDASKPGLEETYMYDGSLHEALDAEDVELEGEILLVSDKASLEVLDLKEGKKKRIDGLSRGFDVIDGKLMYKTSEGSGEVTHTLPLEDIAGEEETMPYDAPEGLKLSTPTLLKEDKPEAKLLEHKLSRLPFFKNNFSGFLSWSGGDNLFVSADYTGKDILEDHVVNVNVFGSLKYYMIGRALYADFDKGYSVNAIFNKLGKDIYVGTSAAKIFTVSKYLQFDVYGGYKFAHVRDQVFDFEGDNHVLKAGMGVGFDTSKWGILGPKAGVKFFASTEAGFSMNHVNLSNIDVNTEVRGYVNIIDTYLSLAFRTAAGTSMGMMPTLYRMGGNNTLRGTPFGMDWGNNYILASAEVRTNIIEVGGLLLRKPLTGASLFTLFPAIELGWYFDIGDAWYYNPFYGENENSAVPFELKYSSGFLINVPTLYGLVFRFSKGVVGEKNFNFWFGVDF